MNILTKNQIYEISKWACKVADRYNRSITYVLMQVHEAINLYEDIEQVKMHVINELE